MADVVDDRLERPQEQPAPLLDGPSGPPPRHGDDGGRGGGGGGGSDRRLALGDRFGQVAPSSWVTLLVVGGLVIYTLAQLSPSLLLTDTTPTGGDMGAHVWGPAFLRDHLLPNLRLEGWSPDWYLGFPAYHFYMVIPALLVVAIDVALPYGVALKLVSVAGIASLPIAAWLLGKLAGLRFPFPPLMAAGAVLFLFDEHFTIYGGNIASTMAGEFSFSIALSLAVFYVAVMVHCLRTGRHRALAAGLLALCALCHLIVSFFAIAATGALMLFHLDAKRFRLVLPMVPVVGLLVAFWMLPFYARQLYMTDMAYERRTHYLADLFPSHLGADLLLNGLAVVGVICGIVWRRRLVMSLAFLAVGYGLWYRVWPQGHLWNARLLPFLYLSRYLLAMIGVGELCLLALQALRRRPRIRGAVVLAVPAAMALVVAGIVGMGMRKLPGGESSVRTNDDGTTTYLYTWGPFSSTRAAVVDDWARWNYTGYEGKDHYGEYRDVVATMAQLGDDPAHGCGRALWENNNDTNSYGTPMALMLLPFWTDGCIGSSEGLFFEASATTPYHFLAAAALSANSSNPVRNLPYVDGDVDRGVRYLQAMGIKYYLAFSPSVVAQADVNAQLTAVATSGPWHVYEVAGSELVTPVANLPVVVEGVGGDRQAWLDLGVAALTDVDTPADQVVPKVASGLPSWPRVQPDDVVTPQPARPVAVSNIDAGTDTISFDVDEVGVPVVVKVSYFPNWEVEGADGPYRVAPNLMLVVPRSTHVELSYGRTGVDLASYGLTLLGLIGLVLLWRRGPIDLPPLPEPRHTEPGAPPVDPGLLADWDEPADDDPFDPVDDDDLDEVWQQLSEVLGAPSSPPRPPVPDAPEEGGPGGTTT